MKGIEKYREETIQKILRDLKETGASNPRGYYPVRLIEYTKRGKYIRESVTPKEFIYEIAKRLGYSKKDVVFRFVREYGEPKGKGHRILLAYIGKISEKPLRHKYAILHSILHPVGPDEPCMFRVKILEPYKIVIRRGETKIIGKPLKDLEVKIVRKRRKPKYILKAKDIEIVKTNDGYIIQGFDDLKII
jgi:hypothetical protein